MTFHIVVFLLSVCLLLLLARLGRLDWFPLQQSSSKGVAKRGTLHRFLKPRTPDDCPACRLGSTPSPAAGLEPAPVRPWCEVKSRRGAPKRIDTAGFACPNPQCTYFGNTDAHWHALVGEWGMGEHTGPVVYNLSDGNSYLGQQLEDHLRVYSEATAQRLDAEVEKLMTQAHQQARSVLSEHRDALDRLTQALLQEEVLERNQVLAIVHGGQNTQDGAGS